jgi:hypothetical protein
VTSKSRCNPSAAQPIDYVEHLLDPGDRVPPDLRVRHGVRAHEFAKLFGRPPDDPGIRVADEDGGDYLGIQRRAANPGLTSPCRCGDWNGWWFRWPVSRGGACNPC